MNTEMKKTTKSTKPVLEYPSIPENTKVMYLRNKNKTPIGCIVYQEKDNGTTVRVNYGYSSMARTDLKDKISPNAKIGRSFAIKHLLSEESVSPNNTHNFTIQPLPEEIRTTRSGRFLLKETVLRTFINSGLGSETFRSKIKKHMQFAAQRAAAKLKEKEVIQRMNNAVHLS